MRNYPRADLVEYMLHPGHQRVRLGNPTEKMLSHKREYRVDHPYLFSLSGKLPRLTRTWRCDTILYTTGNGGKCAVISITTSKLVAEICDRGLIGRSIYRSILSINM